MFFPECGPLGRVGIAKLAAESELLEAKRRVRYFELPARRFLNRVRSDRIPFCWTINPYRGCELGCKYCFARYTHEYMELRDPRQFEEQIYAKRWNSHGFHDELKRLPHGESIAIGTATDPYQPAERRYGVTRRILEVFAGECGWSIGLVTKSDLVVRDIDLLRAIARGNVLHVNLTITTLDERLARLVEPFAPRPALRIEAVRRLSEEGVRTGVLANPIMPLLTDSQASLDALASAAAGAGAESLVGGVLFLRPCALRVFLPFLKENFPNLAARYRKCYARSPFLRGAYADKIKERIASVRAKYRLDSSVPEYRPELWPVSSQLELFENCRLARQA